MIERHGPRLRTPNECRVNEDSVLITKETSGSVRATLPKSSLGIEQAGLVGGGGINAEVFKGASGSHAAAGSSIQKPDLNQIRFDDLFD